MKEQRKPLGAVKRPRLSAISERGLQHADGSGLSLVNLLRNNDWNGALERLASQPSEADTALDPSPLAVACRSGAPLEMIRTLLRAAPWKIRHVMDSRGTPLHEALSYEGTSLTVLAALLRSDEELGPAGPTRATLQQDVDGFTPLHLLIRRRFQSHILQENPAKERSDNNNFMEILELLVKSSPEAVVIPDRGEYEESPIVYALKANIYSPMLGTEDATISRIELQIYDMVACMLKYYPNAAHHVLNGYRGHYTALHSAVFHGRCTKTIELLLQASPQSSYESALLANTQGELPLHFCTMRGERPRTVQVLAEAAPQAISKRDTSGLTPLHWLWVRFVSALLALEETSVPNRRANCIANNEPTVVLQLDRDRISESNEYTRCWTLEQGDFERDLRLIRRMDPSVDFLRMRHIPTEACDDTFSLLWVERSARLLEELRHRSLRESNLDGNIVLTRRQVITCNFWNKVVSLLEAIQSKTPALRRRSSASLLHTAFARCSCPPSVARLVGRLFPEELSALDEFGRLPLHCAAQRPWSSWDIRSADDHAVTNAADSLLSHEALRTLITALELSPPGATWVPDCDGCLVLHHAIRTFVAACYLLNHPTLHVTMGRMLLLLQRLVHLFPASLEYRDGITKLYPFLQATAVAAERRVAHPRNELALTISFQLLLWNPSVLTQLTVSVQSSIESP